MVQSACRSRSRRASASRSRPSTAPRRRRLLRRADVGRAGRRRRSAAGRASLYSPEIEPHDPARLALLGELRRALEGNELQLHYQPKVDLKTHTVVGAEALLRWPHPKRGFVPPADFIPLAENDRAHPAAHALGARPRDRPRRAAGSARGGRLPVAVNVSARSLHDGRIVDDVEEALLTPRHAPRAAAGRGHRERGDAGRATRAGRGAREPHRPRRLGVDRRLRHRLHVARPAAAAAGRRAEDRQVVRDRDERAEGGRGGSRTRRSCARPPTSPTTSASRWWRRASRTSGRSTCSASFGCDQAQGYHIARPMPSCRPSLEWLRDVRWRRWRADLGRGS